MSPSRHKLAVRCTDTEYMLLQHKLLDKRMTTQDYIWGLVQKDLGITPTLTKKDKKKIINNQFEVEPITDEDIEQAGVEMESIRRIA